jgi:uncharacterized protein (DUF2267 family)
MKLFQNASETGASWVTEMADELDVRDEAEALAALRAGLQALRDRLPLEEVAQLSAQLPLLIRGLLFENWDPSGKPLRLRHRADFLALVREKYEPRWQLAPDRIVAALFRLLEAHVSQGEITHIMMALPRDIGALARNSEREELR